jgi:hypothetical protein
MRFVDGASVSCDFVSIIAERLEEMALQRLERIGWDQALLTRVVREAKKHAQESAAALEVEMWELEVNLNGARRDLGNLRPMLEANPRLDVIADEIRKLVAVERELESYVEKLDTRIGALRGAAYDVEAARVALQDLGRILNGLPAHRQVAIIRGLVRRARVWKGRVELDLNEEAVAGLQGLLVEAAGVAQNA